MQRREKLLSKGLQAYAFSQEWIDDYNRAQEASVRYMERKEVFGRIFRAYIRICGSPQREHRLEAVKDMKAALSELEQMGVSFEELAQQKAYRQLTMTTEEGMARFVAFVEEFKKTGTAAGAVDLNHLKKEQERIGRWAKEHAAQLIAAGAQEQWNRASCIAVPSDDLMGYDFIAMKEVKV